MAISKLMRRLGYVKPDDYGLVVTGDDRILATRSAVLDDGLGGKIVGWKEGDLAQMELEPWVPRGVKPAATPVAPPPLQVPKPAGIVAVATPVATMAAPVPRPTLPGIAPYVPPIPTVPVAEATVIAKPAPVEEMTEDDWEWEIAVARARAAAEEAEAAAQAAKVIPISSAPKFVAARTTPGVAPSPAKTVAKTIAKQPIVEDFTKSDDDDWVAIRQRAEANAAVQPKTIIPVPTLPKLAPSAVAPVVRTRFPKGTGPLKEDKTSPAIAVEDQTVPNLPLPPVAPTKLPSIRRATRG